MSQKSNVNPDAYEQAGRDRPGDDILHQVNKQQFAQAEQGKSSGHGAENFIPGAAPVGETEVHESPSRSASRDAAVGESDKSSNSSANSM